ncbi:MAG: hypothetical protein ACP5JG_14805 [Anaerolineae bacterium]
MKTSRTLLLAVCLLAGAFAPIANRVAAQIAQLDSVIYLPIVIGSGSSSPSPNAVENGDFEAGRTAWDEYEDSTFFDLELIVPNDRLFDPITPYDGAWVAWLGGESGLETYIEQEILVPEFEPQLTYWHWIDSIFACDASYGGVFLDDVLVDDYLLCGENDTGGWEKRTVDLAAYAGQTVTLRFLSQTTAENFSSLYIDAVSVRSRSHP